MTDASSTDDELAEDAHAAHRLAKQAFDHVAKQGLQAWDVTDCAAVASALATTAHTLAALRETHRGGD